MATVNIYEAKSNFSQLIARAEAGEEIVIARAGRPVAMLTPLPPESREPRRPGAWAGMVTIHPDFDVLPDDLADVFGATGERS